MSSNATSAKLRVGLLGHGTVGSAFEELLSQRAQAITQLTGKTPEISGILTRSKGDFDEILDNSDVVVELMGGITPAHDYVTQALRAGRHVISANKQLLSQHGEELWQLAREQHVRLGFEAAVGGVVPIINVLQNSLAGAEVHRVHGIVNGTTNYILTEMARSGCSYDQALGDAQRLGFAEADPSEDVSGKDAAAKMAILARLAFGGPVSLDAVDYEGIERIGAEDIAYAREFDLSLKLVGTAERIGDMVSVRVHPVFLHARHPLATVDGSFNAVTVESEAITEITLSGPGAGGSQTASAVLGDLVASITNPMPTVGPPTANLQLTQAVKSAFYLHFEVDDEPGVLATIARILGEYGASIESVIQRGLGQHARLVMVTHPVLETACFAALEQIDQLETVRAKPRAIRVISS